MMVATEVQNIVFFREMNYFLTTRNLMQQDNNPEQTQQIPHWVTGFMQLLQARDMQPNMWFTLWSVAKLLYMPDFKLFNAHGFIHWVWDLTIWANTDDDIISIGSYCRISNPNVFSLWQKKARNGCMTVFAVNTTFTCHHVTLLCVCACSQTVKKISGWFSLSLAVIQVLKKPVTYQLL